jgi:hypothetical protein
MNQTASEYLSAEYGETQRAIQIEFDWLESVLLAEPDIETCSECGGTDFVTYGDDDEYSQCRYCDCS